MRKTAWAVAALSGVLAFCPTLVKVPGAFYTLYCADARSPFFYDALAVMQRVLLPRSNVTCLNYGWTSLRERRRFSQMREGLCLQMYELVVQAAVRKAVAEEDVGRKDGAFEGLDVVEIGSGRGEGCALH